MGDAVDLLFFDTFAHENSEELNLDLVQFPKPVYVTEVRIIPLGARVQADFPGGVRLGATNPSQFSIEFFVNDLGKPGASTFESLGGFEYNQNDCINLNCTPNDALRKIPTDGLVLRGWYTTITLAVYGILTVNLAEQILQPVVPPSIPPQTNSLPDVQQIPVTPIKNEWPQENMQPVPIEYNAHPPTVAYPQTYAPTDQFQQEYTDYYSEVPKDPRSYHNTPESDWDNKSRGRSVEHDRDHDGRDHLKDVDRYQKTAGLEHEHARLESDRRDRDRHYPRSHSQDGDRPREYRESSRDRDRDRNWELERNKNFDYRDHPDKEWDRERNYKHQDNYRRPYARDDREDGRKRPRTPPVTSSRPHTPHVHVELSPEVEEVSEEFGEKQRRNDNQSGNQTYNKGYTEKSSPKENREVHSPVNDETTHMDVEEFEPILSDEDIVDDSEHFQDLDYDYTAYTNNDDLIKLFVPGSTSLQKYKRAEMFNITNGKLEVAPHLQSIISVTDDFFRTSITKYSLAEFDKLNTEIKEEFIHLCEKIVSTIGGIENFCNIIKLYKTMKDVNCTISNDVCKNTIVQTTYIVETLLEWIKIALNFQMANMQIQPAYKIRHIKCGVRLTDWCCNSIHFIRLLWKDNFYIHKELLTLYNQEYMALSIKLMILHALDTYLLHKETIENFIFGRCLNDTLKNPKENGCTDSIPLFFQENGYKILVEILHKNPSVRLKFSLQSILKKLNTFEILYKLHSAISKLRHTTAANSKILCEQVNFIIKSLNQILEIYRNGLFIVSQPKRFLPVSAQFEINRNETKNVYTKIFEMNNLLECFILLLTLPSTLNLSSITTPIFELLSDLLNDQDGLEYLYNNCESVNILLKCLLQNEDIIQYSLSYPAEIKAHTLALKTAYEVQCRYYIDYLLDLGQNNKFDCDTTEILDNLHGLYCLTFSNIGKIACIRVLGFNNNIRCLLQFFDMINAKDIPDQQLAKIKKSPGMNYIIDLICFTVMCNSNVSFIESHIKQLLLIINQQELFETSAIMKINEFSSYVKPFESINTSSYDNVNVIVEMILKHMDTVTIHPGQLITCLRILHHLGISQHANKSQAMIENPLNNYLELKYKHVIIQLFSFDGVSILTKILQKICEFYEQPSLHVATLSSNQGVCIVNTIQPCIDLLKQMLTYVIQCRNTNFKDLTAVPVLLQTYNLLRTFPNTSLMFTESRKLCKKIIDTLLVYTQPISDEINEKDSLNKTLWTLMCGEVVKYINSAPYTFISGLLIFSELLPLPLPLQTRETLTSEETAWAINLRKLWSAHLHCYSTNIQELINRLSTSTHQPLLNLLRKVCIQLADLAANSAIMIARGILDTIHSALILDDDSVLQPCNSNTARLLNLLACLVTHSSLKCAVLQLLQFNNSFAFKGDEKYSVLIPTFAKILAINGDTNSHIQAQECILSIIQSLCDTEITLLQNSMEKNEVTPEIYLANSLPIKETLLLFITMMVDHLTMENSFVTYLPIMRTLLLLTEHDYGFYHLKEYLNKKNEPLLKLLNKLNESFSKDNEECLSTITSFVEFLRVCLTPEEISDSLIVRTIKMTPDEIQSLIGWNSTDTTQHPLYQLESLLKKTIEEDKAFESYLLESVTNIINLIKKVSGSEQKDACTEPALPTPVPLLVQFAGRSIFTLTDNIDEQLTSIYWLSTPSDETTGDGENVTCDINEVCKQNLPAEVNLIREVEKLCRIYSSNNVEQNDAKIKQGEQKDKGKKSFVTPIARRGFPRTIQVRTDLFRSRPPNTSRPPSLHVDDFVALETCGAQPTGPTGYNKISRELLASSRATRGTRGRPFVNSERTLQYRQMSWWNAGLGRRPY